MEEGWRDCKRQSYDYRENVFWMKVVSCTFEHLVIAIACTKPEQSQVRLNPSKEESRSQEASCLAVMLLAFNNYLEKESQLFF